MWSKKLLKAASPPAEAPMPTTSEGGRLRIDLFVVRAFV